MKVHITIALTLLILFPYQSEAVMKSVDLQKNFLQEKFGVDNIHDFLELSPADIAETTGKKLNLKEKVIFKLTQRKINKKIRKGIFFNTKTEYENATNNFNVGGFMLGFFLGPIGVVLAILFGGNALKSSLLGFLCLIIAIAIAVVAAG